MSLEYTEKQIEGLRKIQRLWRRYIDVQVFRFYRDLINFHNNGDPQILMRTINPTEAKYIDPAAGVRIRFRLAGERFPPTIYYKIFTNRPIQDICANAPRDYTRPYLRLKSAVDSNNKLNRFPQQGSYLKIFIDFVLFIENATISIDQGGWYHRIENNGWRPVAYTHLLQVNIDQYFCSNEFKKPTQFAHSRMQRRQDVEQRRKQKKLEWLKKMYKAGMLNANKNEDLKENDSENEMSRLINETTASILRIYNTFGAEAVEDWEVNELLEWTHNLNYDEYLIDWRTVGTSGSSNILVDRTIRYQQRRDVDDRSNSSLTESRHVSMQANVPTNGSVRMLPMLDGEPSFERTPTTALSQPASEHKN
ncbi:unnamed protein product [Rotaria magnacalcarata]|uniref:Uncharacterized protein n=5 Tax=Rotaria magnacalcarata TaxID=392030 RepID=A0A819LII7_9BILA|nr:unnamed protein product [Rotaria magnacalcarata]CAF4026724.1 unnamed protein product [Rotaria magnacalcarata]CAF4425790.1 unnamed protein product [Rotaria magnacalcarata]CAF4469634.1 unnamed protein product [Rotaria magnacalcarata]